MRYFFAQRTDEPRLRLARLLRLARRSLAKPARRRRDGRGRGALALAPGWALYSSESGKYRFGFVCSIGRDKEVVVIESSHDVAGDPALRKNCRHTRCESDRMG